jgi:capsular polysaccharide biosynthesis protein
MQILQTRILGFTLLLAGFALCGTGLWLLLSPTQFQATTKIKLEPDEPNANGQVSYDPYFIQTEFEIIQSPLVLSNVVESLNLDVVWGKRYGDGNPFETVKSIKLLQSRIILEPVLNTRLLKISFSDHDPNEAAGIANAIAKSYSDFRMERHKQLTQKGIQVLTKQFQEEEQAIKVRQEKLNHLGEQLNLPNPKPTNESLKSNYPSYFEAEREFQNWVDLHKVLAAHIQAEKLALETPHASFVQIFDAAKPPKFPVDPNRWLGAVLLTIGLFLTVGGFLLLKSLRQSERL